MYYDTLDEALDDIAKRSFYEDAIVSPTEAGGYAVEDEHTAQADEWYWTYKDGLLDTDSVSETSRLHEPYETYDRAEHIRYNMPESVAALENGDEVTFAYAAVNDADSLDNEDNIIGWILTSVIWTRIGE